MSVYVCNHQVDGMNRISIGFQTMNQVDAIKDGLIFSY